MQTTPERAVERRTLLYKHHFRVWLLYVLVFCLKAVGFIFEAVVGKGQLSELFPDNLSTRLILSPPTVSASILHLFFSPIYHSLLWLSHSFGSSRSPSHMWLTSERTFNYISGSCAVQCSYHLHQNGKHIPIHFS